MKAGEKSIVRRVNWVGQTPLLTLLVLCVVTALLTSRFLSPLNLTNILVQSSIMAVIAMGMTFVIVGGGFDLSVGSTVALSGCIAGMAMLKFGIFAGVAAGIAAGRSSVSPTDSWWRCFGSTRSSPRSAAWCWCAASFTSSPAARR
jgi:predicted ABC-type sugar transport system permease subunit